MKRTKRGKPDFADKKALLIVSRYCGNNAVLQRLIAAAIRAAYRQGFKNASPGFRWRDQI